MSSAITFYVIGTLIVSAPVIDCSPAAGRTNAGGGGGGGTTTYDQKQSGKYNIHLNIKDVAIIAVGSDDLSSGIGDSGSFYDDYYDYNLDDFTISPISAALGVTTKKPKPSHNATTSIAFDLYPTTQKPETTSKPSNVLMLVSALGEDDDDDDNVEIAKPLEDKLEAWQMETQNADSDQKIDPNLQNKPTILYLPMPTGKPLVNKTQSVVIIKDKPIGGSFYASPLIVNATNSNIEIAKPKPPSTQLFVSSTPFSPYLFGSSSSVASPLFTVDKTVEKDESQIPVHIIMEPLLQPKQRPPTNRSTYRLNNRIHKNGGGTGATALGQNSGDIHRNAGERYGVIGGHGKTRRNIYNEDARRRCGRNQVLDRQGRCQSRRSGL